MRRILKCIGSIYDLFNLFILLSLAYIQGKSFKHVVFSQCTELIFSVHTIEKVKKSVYLQKQQLYLKGRVPIDKFGI